jgi:hypothetical protein
MSRAALVSLAFLAAVAPVGGQTTYTWTNTTGNWSVAANWGGTAPTGTNNTDILAFGSAGFSQAYISTNNVADPFILNRLNLGGDTQISGASAGNEIAGSPLRFAGTNPLIDFTSIGNYAVRAPLDLTTDLTIRPNSASGSTVYQLTFGGLSSTNQIAGAGALVIDGTGTTNRVVPFLFGQSSSYSGGTRVLGGATLHIQSDSALGTGGVTLTGSTLRSNVAAGVDTSTRPFALTGANTLATDGFWRFDGAITGGGGVTTANIVGTGAVFRFAGNANTYSGGTTVGGNSQLIALNTAGSATGTGGVTVAANGTLGGTGFVSGAVTVQNNGRVSPGDRGQAFSEAGNLTLNGGVNLSAGGTAVWNLVALSTANPGVDFDVVTVGGGNLALGGTSRLTLEFPIFGVDPNTANAFWNSPRQWRIVDVTGAGANAGNTTFSQITNSTFSQGSFALLDPATQGGDVVLVFTPVPEPATVGLVAVAAAVLIRLTARTRGRR